MKIHSLLISGVLLTALSTNVHSAIIVDGDLSDWGVSHNGNSADWIPNSGIFSTIEDQHSSRLEPGYGGQAYDAEALYAFKDQNSLYIALATGHNPETNQGGGSYGAGDFAIDFGKDGIYDMGINIKPSWDNFGVAGGVYNDVDWAYGLWADDTIPGYVNAEHPTSISQGNYLGDATIAISKNGQKGYGAWTGDMHYFYEMSVDLDILRQAGWQEDEAFNIHWTQNCANDSIIVDPPTTVPAPNTLLLLMAGFIGSKMFRNKNSG